MRNNNEQKNNTTQAKVSIYKRFKELLIAKDWRCHSDTSEQYARVPYVISNIGMAQDGSFFMLLASRAMTTSEISDLIRVNGPSLIHSDQPTFFQSNFESIGIHTSNIKHKHVVYNLRSMHRKYDLESLKSNTHCGECTGEREKRLEWYNELTDANSILLEQVTTIPPVKKTWTNKFERTHERYSFGGYTNYGRPYPSMTNAYVPHETFKVSLKAYEIPNQYEDGPKEMVIVYMVGMNRAGLLECFKNDYDRIVIHHEFPEHYRDISGTYKMFVGNSKYDKKLKRDVTSLTKVALERKQKVLELEKLLETYESLNIGADRPIANVKKCLEALENEDRYHLFEDYTSSAHIHTYTEQISDQDLFIFTTLELESTKALTSAILDATPSKSKTLPVITNNYSVGGRDVSTFLVTNPKYDYQKLMEAYDRYLDFQESHQCTCCRYAIRPHDDLDISVTAQFVKDSNIVEDGILCMNSHGNNDKQIVDPNFRSFIHSIATEDGRYQRQSANSFLFVSEIPYFRKGPSHLRATCDLLVMLTTERKHKIMKGLVKQMKVQIEQNLRVDEHTRYKNLNKDLREKEKQAKRQEEIREAEAEAERKKQEKEEKIGLEVEHAERFTDTAQEDDEDEEEKDGKLVIISYGSSELDIEVFEYEEEAEEAEKAEEGDKMLVVDEKSNEVIIQEPSEEPLDEKPEMEASESKAGETDVSEIVSTQVEKEEKKEEDIFEGYAGTDSEGTFLGTVSTEVQFDGGVLFAYQISSEYFKHTDHLLQKGLRELSLSSVDKGELKEKRTKYRKAF